MKKIETDNLREILSNIRTNPELAKEELIKFLKDIDPQPIEVGDEEMREIELIYKSIIFEFQIKKEKAMEIIDTYI